MCAEQHICVEQLCEPVFFTIFTAGAPQNEIFLFLGFSTCVDKLLLISSESNLIIEPLFKCFLKIARKHRS